MVKTEPVTTRMQLLVVPVSDKLTIDFKLDCLYDSPGWSQATQFGGICLSSLQYNMVARRLKNPNCTHRD